MRAANYEAARDAEAGPGSSSATELAFYTLPQVPFPLHMILLGHFCTETYRSGGDATLKITSSMLEPY
jgi:hypothetical protein